MYVVISHDEINDSIATLKPMALPETNSVHGGTFFAAAQCVVKIYRALIPFFMVLSATPLLPATCREAVTFFMQALDALASFVPTSSVTASIASDTTTTTDPTSTDPSFKAGKDL